MSCQNACCAPKVFTVFTGDDDTLSMAAVQGNGAGAPLDLTLCTEIDVALPNNDGTFSHLLKTEGDVVVVSPAILGQFTAAVDAATSAALMPGEFQSFDVTFTISTKKLTVRFAQALTVIERN